jgi:hypothetical protein
VNTGICPVPLAGRPIRVLELVQVYVVPVMVLFQEVATVGWPAQTIWFTTLDRTGEGDTVITIVFEDPGLTLAH